MKINYSLITRIFGWILLVGGVALIGWTLLYSYNIFTGKVEAPQILKLEAGVEGTSIKAATQAGELDIQKQVESLIQDQLKGFLPTNSIPKLLNLIISSILAGILMFGGGQISSIGIKLVK